MTAARPPVHRCATCGDPIRTACGTIVRQGVIYCCDPCYRSHPVVAR